jgi:hypothetical protein
MNSLPALPTETQPLFVSEGGVEYRVSDAVDPFDAWVQLMEVVEALCPRWPERERRIDGVFLL